MTVGELIEELKKIDGNKIAYGEDGFGYINTFSRVIEQEDNSVLIEFMGDY